MRDPDVLVVGAGPAGISAAAELNAAGLSVLWIDQRDRPGGAIHRQPSAASTAIAFGPASVRNQWRRLHARFQGTGVSLTGETGFAGIDSDGVAILEQRHIGATTWVRAKAIILAVGAVERVLPRPGWHLPGVCTAGGMQVMLKETGSPPRGRVLVAGNGPLTLALATQLAAVGNPPVAVLEASDPFRRPSHALALMRTPRLFGEALHYSTRVAFARIPWKRGRRVVAIESHGGALRVRSVAKNGYVETFDVEHVALHDGIRPNTFGLPEGEARPFIVRAGDCREALGAVAAEVDGKQAAQRVIARLRGEPAPKLHPMLNAERRAQDTLATLFRPHGDAVPADLPDDTILCRCEGRTVGDLRTLLAAHPGISPREVKLNGRFAMGLCQGRFCADNVAALLEHGGETGPVSADALTGTRWPIRPIAIASLIRDADDPNASTPQ
jgi:NADPH-dependent 2,4-dienoyl-CoA reductase/sulfur reductase-like enzyme